MDNSLVMPSIITQGQLDESKRPPLLRRMFGPVREGSLRLTILNIVLCAITGTFFWYPVIYRTYGLIPGMLMITLFVALNYLMCTLVCRASDYAQCNEYLTLVDRFLGGYWMAVAKFTYVMDYFATYVIGFILTWNISAYLLYYLGYIDDSKVEDPDKLTFFDYDRQIVLLRLVVVGASFAISVPLFLQKSMDNLKAIFFGFLITICANIIYLVADMQQFRNHYIKEHTYSIANFKPVTIDSFRYVLIFMCSFYIQSNVLTMKNDTFNPTLPRMMKALRISHLSFFVFALTFGFYGYYCLGDRFTSDLFMLRKSFEGKQYESAYRVILAFMAFFYIIYMSFFNLSMRNFINSNFTYHPNFYLVSLLPLSLAAILAFAYPKILDVLGYNALIVCLLNGFIFPILIMRGIYKVEGKNLLAVRGLEILAVFLVGLAAVSFYAIVSADFGSNSAK